MHMPERYDIFSPATDVLEVQHLPQVDSTNAFMQRAARAGRTHPQLVTARRQTAGHGRLGRAWHGGEGDLMFSLGMPLAPKDWSGLSLAVGVTIAEALHPDVRLKWPNDVQLHGRKLAGILIETVGAPTLHAPERFVIIGVGINIAPRDADCLSVPPAWLRELDPTWTPPRALDVVVPPLLGMLPRFAAHGFALWRERYTERDALRGRTVTVTDGTIGVADGVTSGGALRVIGQAGVREIVSDEVSVRATENHV